LTNKAVKAPVLPVKMVPQPSYERTNETNETNWDLESRRSRATLNLELGTLNAASGS